MIICEWNTSYYDDGCSSTSAPTPSSRKREWKYGVLKLFADKLLFCQHKRESRESSDFEFELLFSNILCFKKTSSTFIFPAITVLFSVSATKNEKYWFSSFENRDETFIFIEHFFQSMVGEKSSKIDQEYAASDENAQTTQMGKELLRSVVDSNKSLAAAGSQLVEQGQQLRNASVKMIEINQDLEVASRFTQGLKSWFPRWRIPKSVAEEKFLVLNKDDASDIFPIDALYRDVSHNSKGPLMKCIVTVEKKGLTIMNEYQKGIQYFNWCDVSRVQVISAWELCITQYLIGKSDRKCTIVSVRAQHLLQQLENYRPDNIEPISSEIMKAWTQHERSMIGKFSRLKDCPFEPRSIPSSLNSSHDKEEVDHLRPIQTSMKVPSGQEMSLLSGELTNLKSLALDVQKVQDEQLEEIDELTSAVTKETDKLSKLKKTMDRII